MMRRGNINVSIFFITIFLISVLNLMYFGKADTTELESRSLQKKPKFTLENVFKGEFFRQCEDYYSDHFMFRDKMVRISSAAKELRGFGNDDGISIVLHSGGNAGEAQGGTASEEQEHDVPAAKSEKNEKVISSLEATPSSENNGVMEEKRHGDINKE